jgi:hypothetical protein
MVILSTFALSIAAFVKEHSPIKPESQIQLIEVNDTVNIKTIYVYDTVVQYIEMITLPETVKVDTSAIIRDYLKFALMESNQDQNDVYEKDSVIEANKKNIKIIYHTIEEKDTFIKYIEKPDEPANTNLFKRNKK